MRSADPAVPLKSYKTPEVLDYGDIHEITRTTSDTAGGPDGGTGVAKTTAP